MDCDYVTHAESRPIHTVRSEITTEGKRVTKLDQILLNGNNVALVRERPRKLVLTLLRPDAARTLLRHASCLLPSARHASLTRATIGSLSCPSRVCGAQLVPGGTGPEGTA